MTTFHTRCPACAGRLHPNKVLNALSRYVDAYVCNNCKVDEATEGFFWVETAKALRLYVDAPEPNPWDVDNDTVILFLDHVSKGYIPAAPGCGGQDASGNGCGAARVRGYLMVAISRAYVRTITNARDNMATENAALRILLGRCLMVGTSGAWATQDKLNLAHAPLWDDVRRVLNRVNEEQTNAG